MVVVAAHTPCQGRAVGRGRGRRRTLRYGPQTEEPRVPKPVGSNVSRFSVPSSMRQSFRLVPCPAATAHGLTMREGEIVVRCSKKHKGKESAVRTRRKRTHHGHIVHRTAGVFLYAGWYFRVNVRVRLLRGSAALRRAALVRLWERAKVRVHRVRVHSFATSMFS